MSSKQEPLGGVEWLGADHRPEPAQPDTVSEEALEVGSDDRRRRIGLLVQALIAVLALIAASVWYITRPDPAAVFSYDGKTIANPAKVIARADAALASYTRAQHGAMSTHARCYFDRVGGQVKTNVGHEVYCGPVLFFGGHAPQMYLRFALVQAGSAANGDAKLDVEKLPASTSPGRLPKKASWERPDGSTVPFGADDLLAPKPPPARADVVLRVAPDMLPALPSIPDTAFLASRNITVRLRGSGYVPYYGNLGRARSAFPGQKLLAAELEITDGDLDFLANAYPQPTVYAQVDARPVRILPLAITPNYSNVDLRRFVVLSVPNDVHDVELVLTDAGVTQRLSLLTGAPAAGNIAVLQRSYSDRLTDIGDQQDIPGQVTVDGKTNSTTVTVQAQNAFLSYFSPYGPQHASGPDRALLEVSACIQVPDFVAQRGACFSSNAVNQSLRLPSGSTIRAHNYGPLTAFDVPATFHSGVLTLAGPMRTVSGWTVQLAHPYKTRIVFYP